MYGEAVEDVFRRYAELRYRLWVEAPSLERGAEYVCCVALNRVTRRPGFWFPSGDQVDF